MTTTSVVCPECESPVAPGRLSCQSCGMLLASVVGSSHRYANAAVVDPMLPDVDEDKPIASARRATSEPEPPAIATPIVAETLAPVPPTQPAKRAPRRLSRSKPAAASATTELDAQTEIFGPVPNVAPPILQGWTDSGSGWTDATADAPEAIAPLTTTAAAPTAVATLAVATLPVPSAPTAAAPRPPKAPRNAQPASAPMNGNARLAPSPAPATLPPVAASTNGATASGRSIAGAYLAPSAVYASPIVDRPPPSAGSRPASAGTATTGIAPAATPAWPSPVRPTAPGGSANGTYAGHGSSVATASAAPAAITPAVRRMSDWLVIGGATLAIVSFVLPWATDGVLGSNGTGFTAQWGLANPGHLLLIVAAAVVLVLQLVQNPVPGWIRSSVLPIAVGGLLGGLAFAYYARPFGGGTGVAVLLAGAVLLVVGGVAASRVERNETSVPTV